MKKIILLIHLLTVGLAFAQNNLTQAENYIYEKNCLTEDCSKKTESVQYFDGLGRLRQSISIKATPGGKDIAVPVEYDGYGRQVKSYLPVPQSGTQNGAIYDDPLANAFPQYGNEKIYAEKIPEASPLGRTQQQAAAGTAWASHPVQFSYAANTSADAVKKYTVATTWLEGRTNSILSDSGTYSENTLYRSSVTDEDGNETVAFRNQKGQTVATRRKDGLQNADTYYVYNEYGQLAYTIPPLAAASAITSTVLDNLCYQYRYDGWNRLVEKKIPGKGWEYRVYDKQDRLVLAQDANLRTTDNNFAAKGWMFTKYDQFGRVVYTGFFSNTATRTAMQAALNNMAANAANNESGSTTPFVLNGMEVYYTKNAFPTGSMRILSINYYDRYPSYDFNPAFPPSIMGKTLLSDNSTAQAVSTKSLPVMNLVKNIEDDNWTKNYMYYDVKGRIIGTYSINHLGGYSSTETDLDFAGVPQKTSVYHVRKAGESGVTVKQRYVYDNRNRLLMHYHQVDSRPEELLSENTYNELSQLISKKTGNNLQSTDYAYNIRGWLTDVNKNQMASADLGGKLFSYTIRYNQKDGISNPDPLQFTGKNVIPRYNGNIAEIDWRVVETPGVNPPLTPERYGYAYDSMNRLTAGYYQNPDNPYSKENTESLSYDLNGNITALYRTSIREYGSNTATVIDNLSYAYTGNQATGITDASQNATGYEGGGTVITYDRNGNMVAMPDKGISSIRYNYLNLPNYLNVKKFENENVTINTRYRSDGTKLRKENTTVISGITGNTTTVKVTDYLDGFQYFSSAAQSPGGNPEMMSARAMQPQAFTPDEAKTLPAAKTPDLQYFPTAEGFYDYAKDQYIYQHKDHLGNVRVSYGRNSAGALEITDANDYYPFGMNHLKTGNAYFGQGSYKNNKYNGKELQETGLYSYGWREYMPDIARWNGIDQFAETYHSTSTYAYVANNPVSYVDVDGRWFNEDGTIDTSGQANPFAIMGSSYKPAYINSFMGVTAADGGGGSGGYTFSGQAAASMFDYFANGGSMSGISFNKGWAIWGTVDDVQERMYYNGEMATGDTDGLTLHRARIGNTLSFEGIAQGGLNWVQSHPREITSIAGAIEGSSRLAGWGLDNWNAPSNISKSRIFAETISTRLPASAQALGKFSTVLKWGGRAVGAIGIANSLYQGYQGNISTTRAAVDTIMGVVGFFGPWGAAASLVYFGGMAVYEHYYNDDKSAF